MRGKSKTRKQMLQNLHDTVERAKSEEAARAKATLDSTISQLLAYQRAGLDNVPITEALRLLGWREPQEQQVQRLPPGVDPITGCLPVAAPQTELKPASGKPAGFVVKDGPAGPFDRFA